MSATRLANVRGNFQILFEQPFGFERMAVRRAADGIFLGDHALELLAQAVRIHHVAHANSAPRHFVFVRRADSARSGADLRRAARRFRGFVHFAMVGKNQVRAIAEEKPPANFDARFLQIFELGDQRDRIDHGSRSDHRFLSRRAKCRWESIAARIDGH